MTDPERILELEATAAVHTSQIADLTVERIRLESEFLEMGKKCEKLIAKVNEFVGRFSVIQ